MRVRGQQDAPTIRKILSLDGCGVRGLSTIMVLRYIMKILEEQRGVKLEPWQEFDMIGGASTGGLIAIMLGRLRMSLDECEAAYLTLSQRIFTPTHSKANIPGCPYNFLQADGKFDSKLLEDGIKEILRDHYLPETELLKENGSDACKVFVCAVHGNDATAVIRSYQARAYDRLLDVCKIWEAARATSATSRLFEPITVGPFQQKFVDGALGHNNPIDLADSESSGIWPQQDRLIISIGAGNAPGKSVDSNILDLVQTLAEIATDTEERNNIFRATHPDMVKNDRLFRFNVYHGLADVGLEEYNAVDRIADHTDHYLGQYDTAREIEKCVDAMRSGGQRLNFIGGEG
ncbi:hypothetical protein GP486_003538 [Trichoglossum hirsutum]|uniref:PNPLA domain-containing protein n=1 Tax=Trichoglossum hirsutum TaxID=265104 RepID=A0A9P8LCY0_9PEZI|nr:hypothetical protein GP486_003538 [Trichoglossum hirsutum]